MPTLSNIDFKAGFDESVKRIKSPFDRFFAEAPDVKGAQERNDFKSGLILLEYQNGKPLESEKIILKGASMPHQPFEFGGSQKLVFDYYPGNSEPSVQVLGPRENDITFKGRFKAKLFAIGQNKQVREDTRLYAQELQELVDAMRIRGNIVELTMGNFTRYGFIESCKFMLKTLADIDYEINFKVVGFNFPRDCKFVSSTRVVPFNINKDLINAINAAETGIRAVPDSVPQSLAEQLNDAISEVATAINLVTDFIDGVLEEVDQLEASVNRALGLIKNARTKASQYQRRVGGFDPTGGVSTTNGIAAAYANTTHFQNSLSSIFSLTGFLAGLADILAKIARTEPLSRYKIQSGDTLQRLAVKFYDDVDQWSLIYDHNKLQSTDLELIVGQVIEIPRVD